MLPRLIIVVLLVLFGRFAYADAQSTNGPGRGELLYSNHCIACHNEQVHWRDKKLARDWNSLHQEVRRWQKTASLGWSDEEIAAVTQYLNTRYYHYPAPY